MDPSIAGKLKKIKAEQLAMRDAVAGMFMAWSALENAFAQVLCSTVGLTMHRIPLAIYFAPTNAETRIKMVDSGFRELLALSGIGPSLVPAWEKTLNTVNRLKATRNVVAHGSIGQLATKRANHVRLMPPMLDMRRYEPAFRDQQLPGLSVNDINQSAEQLFEQAKRVELFAHIAEALHTRNFDALLQRFAELGVDPPTSPLPPDDPKPPKRKSPRRS